MEITGSILLIGLIALTAGALIGVLGYRLLAPSVKQAEQVRSERDAARDELESYRDSVNEHFDKTAELVNELTQDYVRVYQHLAEGAQSLGDGKRFDNLLEQQPGKVAIAVDDDSIAPRAGAGASVVAAGVATVASAAPAAAVPEAPSSGGDSAAEITPGPAPAPAEPAEDRAVAAPEVADAPEGDGEASLSETTGEAPRPAESMEPVLNVDALDEALEKADREDDDAAATVAKGGRETEVRTTTH